MRTKTLILAMGAQIIAAPAFAADLPSYKSPPAPYIPPPPLMIWTGFYVGVNGGYGGGALDTATTLMRPASAAPFIPGALLASQGSTRMSGFLAGGQIGYNYQLANNVVLGVEADMQWSDIRAGGSTSATVLRTNGVDVFTASNTKRGIEWFGTGRARIGYAFGPLMPYVTGGIAYGDVVNSSTGSFAGPGSATSFSTSATKVGWAAGAGAEYAFAPHWSLKTEYLYVSLPGVSGPAYNIAAAPTPAAVGWTSTGNFGAHIVRAGLNWKFGDVGPTVARY